MKGDQGPYAPRVLSNLATLGGVPWGGNGSLRSIFLPAGFGYRSQQLTPMTERHPDLFKVLIDKIGQDGKADIVLGKALPVLSETELLKPVSDLLHRGSAPDYRASPTRIG